MPEPTTRLQKWGASQLVEHHRTDVESDLFNINRPSVKSPCGGYNPNTNRYNGIKPTPMPEASFTQTYNRLGDPPCTLRGTGWNRWEYLCQNPQENVMMPFDWFVPGRILSKDSHRPCIPKPNNPSPSLPTPLNNWSDSFYGQSDNMVAREQVKAVVPATQDQWTSNKSDIACPAPVGPPSVTWNRSSQPL